MKKLLLISISACLLTACAEKEQYQQAILEDMKTEQDVKDYKIDPERMSQCVVDLSSKNMPGAFGVHPDRLTAYKNYTKMLTLKKSEDPKKTLDELRKDFGSAKNLAEAHTNYTESVMNCYAALLMETEETEKEKDE